MDHGPDHYNGMTEKQRRDMWRELNSQDRQAKRAVRARLMREIKKKRRNEWRERQKEDD